MQSLEDFVRNVMFTCKDRNTRRDAFNFYIDHVADKSKIEICEQLVSTNDVASWVKEYHMTQSKIPLIKDCLNKYDLGLRKAKEVIDSII